LYSCEPVTEIEYVETEVEVETIVEKEVIIETEVEVEVEIEKEVEVVTVVETETLIDNVIETIKIEYVNREVYIMSEEEVKEFIMEPITEYSNYVSNDNKVFGVTSEGFEEIAFIKGLFKIDGVIYFEAEEKLYSQVDGVLTIIDELPVVPESEYIETTVVEGETAILRITKDKYNDIDISKVYNRKLEVAYLQIDSTCMRGDDLLYSVCQESGTRKVGVYIWTVNSSSPRSVFDSGRIW
jgi:hypothetical protein